MEGVHQFDKYGQWRFPGVFCQEQTTWSNAGQITSQQAALAANAMNNTSVEALAAAKKVIYEPKNGIVGLEFRFRTDGVENDQNVLQIYAAAGADFYTRVTTIIITQGTADSAAEHFCDIIAKSNEAWLTPVIAVSGADNHIARLLLNTHGYDRFLFICSTLTVTTVFVDVRPF